MNGVALDSMWFTHHSCSWFRLRAPPLTCAAVGSGGGAAGRVSSSRSTVFEKPSPAARSKSSRLAPNVARRSRWATFAFSDPRGDIQSPRPPVRAVAPWRSSSRRGKTTMRTAARPAPPATAAPSTVRRLTGSLGPAAASLDGLSSGPAMLMRPFNPGPGKGWSPRCQRFVRGGPGPSIGPFLDTNTIIDLESAVAQSSSVRRYKVMFGPRMLLGAVVGGALVYFLDPQNGAARRQRLADWWEQNREPVINSATSAA